MPKQPPMTYSEAIELLALNDNPVELDPQSIEASIAVQMVADIYRTNARSLARTISRYRKAVQANK